MVRSLPLALVQRRVLLTQPTLREALVPQTDDGCSLLRQFLGFIPEQTRQGSAGSGAGRLVVGSLTKRHCSDTTGRGSNKTEEGIMP